MVNSILQRIRTFRKAQYFKEELFQTKKKYAFVGMGMHSLTNLYPVLKQYNIGLKYICTKTSSWDNQAKILFPECTYTNSLDKLLDDPEVEGIFISATPSSHFELLRRCLQASKKVFIEKPPCHSLKQLEELIDKNNTTVCKVGLQRRYWPANKILLKKVRKAGSYTYHFHTGSYIDGDIFTELFIHPLDYALFLFGSATIKSSSITRDDSGVTVHIHLIHKNGISGMIECSTQHNWNNPKDELIINTHKESLTVNYPVSVKGETKPSRVLNIPAERILNNRIETIQYFSSNNFILPVAELNTIYLQGFYSELRNFINIVEGKHSTHIQNDLPGLTNLYQIIEQVKTN
jgi:virulence factor